MSKYVNKKHGLVIGSDNMFYIVNDGPEIRDGYRAIVWAQVFKFEQVNTVNVFVRTPAQQIMWKEIEDRKIVISNWCRHWLLENVGKEQVDWDVRSAAENVRQATVFFKKRKHALEFTMMIEKLLKGVDKFGY